MFWQILLSIALYGCFLEGFDLYTINLSRHIRLFQETFFIVGPVKHFHYVINLLYYEHWTDKQKYIPYISVTLKVLKSCRSKMVTSAHDVCDVHGASSVNVKPCWQKFFYKSCLYVANIYIYIYIYTARMEGFPPPAKMSLFYPLSTKFFIRSPL